MKIKSVQTILFASFIGIVFLSLAIFVVLINPRIYETAIGQLSSDLYKQARLSSADYTSALQRGEAGPALQKMTLKTAGLSQSRVSLINNKGKVLADSEVAYNKLNSLGNHLDRPEVVQALKYGHGKAVHYSATLGKNLIYVAIPLRDGRQRLLGFLRFSVPPVYAADLTARINRSGIAALAIAILIAILLSVILAHSYSLPIVRLSKVANKIAQGQFPQTIILKSRFEIRKLEEAVEIMSQRLAEMFHDLSAERGQLSTVLSGMAEGVLAVNRAGQIILVNPAIERMFGVVEPEVLDKTVRAGLRNNEISDLLEESARNKKEVNKEINIVTPIQGDFIAHASPILDNSGRIVAVVCVLHDVTEIKKLEGYRSEFVANVSHELKTPLTAIRSYVETLLGGAIDDQAHNREFLAKIDKHASNLSVLIDDILEISKLEARRELGAFVPLDLYHLVGRAVDTISEKAKRKGIEIVNNCRGEGLTIMGIEDHIYRAILNILDNSVNYNIDNGRVQIDCEKEEGKVKVIISDTGIGIPAKDLPRIFERFYRVDKARSRNLGGTGLGLAIVKHVISLHNGTVTVESEEGKGSKFTVTFPA